MAQVENRNPPGVTAPVHQHSSDAVKSIAPAGGEVPVTDYAKSTPPKQ